MTKEEKERKEAVAKAEFDRRMQQLRSTMPPSDSQLLKSVAAVPLSPAGASGGKESVFPIVPSAVVTTTPLNPEFSGTDVTEKPKEEVLPQQSSEAFSPSQRAAARVNAANDPKLEALLDTIAHQVKAQRRQQSGLKRRVLVKVDSDIFSRVSNVSYARRLDKIEVLTYLLSRYLPEAGREELPAWLVQERPDDILNSFHLVYHEDSEIARRFTWLEQRFGLLKVDIVAAIVTRYLPASPFVVPPKRRPRRKRF
jgi:hypothetical protein